MTSNEPLASHLHQGMRELPLGLPSFSGVVTWPRLGGMSDPASWLARVGCSVFEFRLRALGD